MNELMKFDFNNNQVRVVNIDNEPWFLGFDVCNILEVKNPSDAYTRLKEYERHTIKSDTLDSTEGIKNPEVVAISESGLYRLVLTSRKPQAEPFQDWVCQTVIPEIRKTGGYNLGGSNLPQTYLEALKALVSSEEQKQLAEEKTKQVEGKLGKAEDTLHTYRAVICPDSCLDVTQIAKAIGVPNFGRNKLFEYLRSKNFIQQKPSVVPYQSRIDKEHAVVETVSVNIGGEERIKQKTKFTFKGLEWLVKRLKNDGVPVHADARAIWDSYNT